jgi:hypothetical protein
LRFTLFSGSGLTLPSSKEKVLEIGVHKLKSTLNIKRAAGFTCRSFFTLPGLPKEMDFD